MEHDVEDTETANEDNGDSFEDMEGSDEGALEVAPQSKVIIEKADRSLSEFQRWYKEGRLIIDPEWQRNYLWKPKRASRLIESFMMDMPVPVIYLAKNNDGKYEVIDGLQRLTSIFNFFDNKYKLTGLEVKKEFENKLFKELSSDVQYKLQDVTLRSFELDPSTPKNLLFLLFERLNTGGIALNRMEVRNCVFRGTLNDLIKKLSIDETFIKCHSIGNLSQRMKDRELVLRFLAFYEKTYHKCNRGLGLFLNDFFETYKEATDVKLREFEKAFDVAMKATYTIFGDKGFRLRSSKGGWNQPINAAVFQTISVSFTRYDLSHLTRSADAIYEEYLDLISSDNKWS